MRPGLFFVAFTAALVVIGCGDTDSPTAPTAPPTTPMASQQASQFDAPVQYAPPDAGSSLAPGGGDGLNAYDFHATYDGSMLSLALVEDEMRSMREASKPHRNRRITVDTCPVEPHHALQACGAPLWEGTRRIAGRLELPPIPLSECDGWIIVYAAELSDDATDGWRNAPCPTPDGESVVGSDGTGDEWPEYPSPEPSATPRPPETVQSNVDAAISAAGGLTAGGAPRSVGVSDLFEGARGTEGGDYSATSSDETVATVEVTDNPRVVVTPVGAGTATIEVVFLMSGAEVRFDVTVAPGEEPEEPEGAGEEPEQGAPPTITVPEDKEYEQGQTIEAFSIAVRDADGDTVTVTVTGLPEGLTSPAASGDGTVSAQVSGTVAADAEAQAYPVTVTANDGVNEAVTETFTITVAANDPPVITNPGNQTYGQGAMRVSFPIEVSDPDGDEVTVTVDDLPAGLTWSSSSGMVSGMVSWSAPARAHTVTVTADDGVNEAVTATFTITVTAAGVPTQLFDSTGPFVFFLANTTSNQIETFWLPFLMLGGTGCPTSGSVDGTTISLTPNLRVRGGAAIPVSIGIRTAPSWTANQAFAERVTVTEALDSRFGWRGGPAARVDAVWPGMNALTLGLVGNSNDPDGLVTRPVNQKPPGSRNGRPPYANAPAGRAWYVTDTLEFSWTQTTPAPPASGYCVVAVSDCTSTSSGGTCA